MRSGAYWPRCGRDGPTNHAAAHWGRSGTHRWAPQGPYACCAPDLSHVQPTGCVPGTPDPKAAPIQGGNPMSGATRNARSCRPDQVIPEARAEAPDAPPVPIGITCSTVVVGMCDSVV
jgi:hypothetical protein